MEAEKAGELILKRARTEPHSRVIGAPFAGASFVAL